LWNLIDLKIIFSRGNTIFWATRNESKSIKYWNWRWN
jgi:hypothetical protein